MCGCFHNVPETLDAQRLTQLRVSSGMVRIDLRLNTGPVVIRTPSLTCGFSGSVAHCSHSHTHSASFRLKGTAREEPRSVSRTTGPLEELEVAREMSELGGNAAFMIEKAVGCLQGSSELS